MRKAICLPIAARTFAVEQAFYWPRGARQTGAFPSVKFLVSPGLPGIPPFGGAADVFTSQSSVIETCILSQRSIRRLVFADISL